MTWYYALGNERQGPIDDAALDRLIAAGTVTPETLVWRAGMADWQPLAQARPRATPVPTPVIPPPPAAITTPVAADPSTEPRFGTPVTPVTPAPAAAPAAGAYGAAGSGYASASGAAGWSEAAGTSSET